MLEAIRERSKGLFAWLIVVAITIPFALWGIENYRDSAVDSVVASVNGTEIQRADFQQAYQRQLQQWREQLGNAFDPQALEQAGFRRALLEDMINETLLQQTADAWGLHVDDGVLARSIAEMTIFHENGAFSAERYRQQLQAAGITPAAFEQSMRRSLRIQLLRQGVAETVPIPGGEVERVRELAEQERRIRYYRLPAQAYLDDVSVDSEQAIEAYYQTHQEAFRTPERIRLAYVVLDRSAIEAGISASEADLRAYYQDHRDRYRTEARRHVRHILFAVPQDADQAAVTEARQAAEAARSRLADGAQFQALARELSDDSVTAGQGGDLGALQRGVLEPPLDQAVFSLAEGDVSEPVRSDYGFHLLQVTEIQPAQQRDFEAVRDEVAEAYREAEAEARLHAMAERLSNLTYEHPEGLAPAAEALSLEVKTTDWFRRGAGEGIAANPEVQRIAFSDALLKERRNSDLLELAPGRVAVVRAADHQPAAVPPLEAVREDVIERLRQERAAEQAREAGQALVQAARSGESLDALLAEYPVERVEVPDWIGRNAGSVPQPVIRTAFRLAQDQVGGTVLGTGDFAVVEVLATRLPEASPAALKQWRQVLGRTYGDSALDGLLRSLRAAAEVRVREDLLQ